MRIKLTNRSVRSITPESRSDVYAWDTDLPGFLCRAKPTGTRTFFAEYVAPGLHRVNRRVKVGRFPTVGTDDARSKAREILAQAQLGRDVGKLKADERRSAREETVERLFEDYLEHAKAHFKESTVATLTYDEKLHIRPRLGKLPVQKVSTRDVAKLHHELREKQATANRVVRTLKAFFNWLERRGHFAGQNPGKHIELYREVARERFLSLEEVGKLGQALTVASTHGLPSAPQHRKHHYRAKNIRSRNAGMFKSELRPANPVAVAALRFLILTGWREREALTLRWEHVDLARGRATLPDTKTGKSSRSLGAAACDILDEQPRVEGCPFVFPGRTPDKPLAEIQRLWYSARHHAGIEDVRLHDLRHSVASFAGGQGYSLFLIQKLLGHKDARSTERYAHLADDIRKVMADDVSGTISRALNGQTKVGATIAEFRKTKGPTRRANRRQREARSA